MTIQTLKKKKISSYKIVKLGVINITLLFKGWALISIKLGDRIEQSLRSLLVQKILRFQVPNPTFYS